MVLRLINGIFLLVGQIPFLVGYRRFEAAEKVLSGSPKILIFGESMEKAIDFCFRTGGTAGSVVTTQIATARFIAPGAIRCDRLAIPGVPDTNQRSVCGGEKPRPRCAFMTQSGICSAECRRRG